MLPYRFNKGQHMTQKTKNQNPEFGRAADIAKELSVSINTVWRLARNHEKTRFPKPIKLSDKVTVWRLQNVRDWVASKEAAR